jgi:hypothetical protein
VTALSDAAERALAERLDCVIVHDDAELQAVLDRASGGPELYVSLIWVLLGLLYCESLLSLKVGGA